MWRGTCKGFGHGWVVWKLAQEFFSNELPSRDITIPRPRQFVDISTLFKQQSRKPHNNPRHFRDTINQLHDSFHGSEREINEKSSRSWMKLKSARHIGIYHVSYAIWKWVFFDCGCCLPACLNHGSLRAIEHSWICNFLLDCHLKRANETFSAEFSFRDLSVSVRAIIDRLSHSARFCGH